MKKRLVVANWKRYIESQKDAKDFVSSLRRRSRLFSGVDVVIAPAFPLLPSVAAALKGSVIKVSAQSVSSFDDPKQTGEVSAAMVRDAGAHYTIIGHSERRALGETDEMVRAQLQFAAASELVPILCIGEKERTADGAHFETIENQLSLALTDARATLKNLIVAYEPVWAIGKRAESAMQPNELEETVIFIRKKLTDLMDRKLALKVPILYGGSVEAENAHKLIKEGGVSGFLVGHASAQLDSFLEILKAVRPTHGKHART